MQQLFCATVIFVGSNLYSFLCTFGPQSHLQKGIFDFQILHFVFSQLSHRFLMLFVEFMKKKVGFFRMRGVCPPLFSPPRLWGVNFFSTRGWGSLVD